MAKHNSAIFLEVTPTRNELWDVANGMNRYLSGQTLQICNLEIEKIIEKIIEVLKSPNRFVVDLYIFIIDLI